MKKYLFGLFAIVFAVALSAFTSGNQASSTMFADEVFEFIGDPTLTADIENPLKYQRFVGNPETFCGDPDELLCVIVVPTAQVYTANDKPKVDTDAVNDEIHAAILAGADDVTGTIKVYLKPE